MSASSSSRGIERVLFIALTLAAAWLLWSGIYKPLLIALGALSCALVLWLVQRMGYLDDGLYARWVRWRLFAYWFWLGREIFKSSLAVTRAVLSPTLSISPTVVEIKSASLHPFDQVILGNSITLTPGTLTLDVHRGVLKVHALHESGARELLGGEMNRRVAELHSE
ncbi:MAG: Na+/H+ antiporter subunit E [Pseudomonadota bacterium]